MRLTLAWLTAALVPLLALGQSTGGVPALREELTREAYRAQIAEGNLSQAVAAEETKRQAADLEVTGFSQAYTDSKVGAANAALKSKIDVEVGDRQAAVASALSNLATEAASRASADASLQAVVSAEGARAASAEGALSSALVRETALRRAANRSSAGAVQNQIDALTTALNRATSELAQVKAMLSQVDASVLASPRSIAAACGSQTMATRVSDLHATLTPALQPQVRAWTITQAGAFARTQGTALEAAALVQRFPSSAPPTDVMGALLNVFKESIEQTNSDKGYMLDRLAQMQGISDALTAALQEYADLSRDLGDGLGGGDSSCGGDDSEPLSAATRADVAARIGGLKGSLTTICCGRAQDPTHCAFIMDPLSCPSSPADEIDLDVGITPPTTTGELRNLIAIGQAKLAGARTSMQSTTQLIQRTTARTSNMCQRLSELVNQLP